jgi:hypothetical protein
MGAPRFDAGAGPSFGPWGLFHLEVGVTSVEQLVGNLPGASGVAIYRVEYASVGVTRSGGDLVVGAELAWKDNDGHSVPLIACSLSPSLEISELGVGVPQTPLFACAQLSTGFVFAGAGNFYLGGLSEGLGGSQMWATVVVTYFGGSPGL